MPLPTNPKAKCEVWLESDEHLAKIKRPIFIYRYLTGHQQMDLADTMDRLEQAKSGRDAFEKVFAAAATGLISWKRVVDGDGKAIPFDATKLSDVVGLTEANELIQKLLSQSPPPEAKKKSVSQSASAAVLSKAADTAQAKKRARTSRTP